MTFQLHPYQRMLVYLCAITPRCQKTSIKAGWCCGQLSIFNSTLQDHNFNTSGTIFYYFIASRTTSATSSLQDLRLLLHHFKNYICYFIASGITSATSSLQELHLLLHRFRNYICYFIASGTMSATSSTSTLLGLHHLDSTNNRLTIYFYAASTTYNRIWPPSKSMMTFIATKQALKNTGLA